MKRVFLLGGLCVCVLVLCPSMLQASEHLPHIPGKELGIIWVIPFVCMLLSIALGPMVFPHFWEHHYGKVAVFWSLCFLVPCAIVYGMDCMLFEAAESILLEYIPFFALLFSLFTVAGGVCLRGTLIGTPVVNTCLLAIGTILASLMGTTGAAMLLIRPMLAANAHRKYRVHQIVFFIFLVANIGGSLTPLGDPPLFVGYLKGVSFFWTLHNLVLKTLFMAVVLLAIYFILDTILYKKEGSPKTPLNPADTGRKLYLEGEYNLFLLICVVLTVLVSGVVLQDPAVSVFGVEIKGASILQTCELLLIAGLSWKVTDIEIRNKNGFTWGPIKEVGKLFFGIFLSMIPAIAILRAGTDGALSQLISLVSSPDGQPVNAVYFWLTGMLSTFLDNCPTYVVFFNTAGGDPATLMGPLGDTLVAISAGAVFMGANSYIGNAPNFMVRSIAEERGVKMPSFFGYMAWSFFILLPLYAILTLIFFV